MERGRPFPSSSSFEGLRLRERPGLSAALPPKQLGEELLSAAAAGDLSRLLDAVVRLESGQDICNFNGPKQRTPLHLACLAGSEVCLDLLLRHTTMVDATDAKGKTALALAAKKGCTGLVLKLLQRNASHQAGDENGNTPLHQAAYHGHLETVRCLLDNGAEINPLNEILSTPLHFAAMCGHHAVCELLLQRGGDPNGKNKNSTSALHLAARNGYVACCRVLLQAGADVNCVDPYDQIPLHLAARTGHSDCIELMLEEGAHVNAMDTEGSTAFDWADDFGHGECAVLLWEKGALIKTQTGKETMRWSRPCASGDVPTMRYDHAMAPLGDRIVVFGGYGIPPRRSPLRKQLSMLSSNKTQGGEEEERAAHMNDVYILDASMQVMSIGKQISMDERGKLNMELSNTRKGANLQLCGDGLTVEYIREEIAEVGISTPPKPSISPSPFSLTSQPFRRIGDETIAYFEVTVLNQGLKGYIAIGLTDRSFPLNKQPGWVKQSYGYHGDDGQVYHNQGSGIPFGPRFGTGDVVGCGLNYDTGEVFFTKNGAFLGVGWTDARNKELFPSVGLHSPEEKVLFNFGKKPFKFNFDSEMVHWYSASATGTIPAARSASTLLALDNRRLLLFGGYSPHEMYNDIHLFDAELFTWTHCQTQGLAPTWRDSSASIVRVDGKHSPSHISRSSSFSSPSLSFSSLSSLASSSASLASSLLSAGGSEDNGNGMTLTRSSLTEVRDSLNFGVSGKRKKVPWEEEEEEEEEVEEEEEEEEREEEQEEEELEVEELEEEEEREENEPTDDEEEDYEENVKGAEEDCKGCNDMKEERENEHAIDGEAKKQRTEQSTFEEQEAEEETEVTQTDCLVQMLKEEAQNEERGGYSALLVFGGRFSNRCFNTVHRMYLYDEDVLQQQLQQQQQQLQLQPQQQNSQPEETIPASSSSDASPSSTSETDNNTHNNRHQSFVWEDITAEIRGTPPRPRASHAAAVIGARLWIFGGLTEEKTLLNDVHVLDFEQMKWQKLKITGRPPTPRQNATLTAVGNRLFIFGGWDGRRQHNDIHVLDTERMHWYKPHVTGTVPRPRNHHTSAALSVNGKTKIFSFAGWNGRGYVEDLDVLDIEPEEKTDLGVYCNSRTMSDVTFLVEGQQVYAHKIILGARSLFFREMLLAKQKSGDVEEDDGEDEGWSSEFVITDVAHEVFVALLHFLYTDVADASTEMIGPLLQATKRFAREHLDRIAEYLILTRLKAPSLLNKNLRWAFDNPHFYDILFLYQNSLSFPSFNDVKQKQTLIDDDENDQPTLSLPSVSSSFTSSSSLYDRDEQEEMNGRILHGHKAIICARSPYFRAMLLGGLKESRDRTVRVDSSQIRFPIFYALIKYLYINDVELEDDGDWIELLVAANQYSVELLKEICEDVLEQSLDVHNVACLLGLADQQQALSLRKGCMDFMVKNYEEVCQAETFSELSETLRSELEAEVQKNKQTKIGWSLALEYLHSDQPSFASSSASSSCAAGEAGSPHSSSASSSSATPSDQGSSRRLNTRCFQQ